MKAAVVKAFGQPLVVTSMPDPVLRGHNDALVRVHASGACHTDLHAASGDWPVKPRPPFIPGHEGVGVVEAVGDSVIHFKVGDRVGVPWLHSACGICGYCLSGWETLCPAQQNTGYSVNGGFAELVVADARYVGRIPVRLRGRGDRGLGGGSARHSMPRSRGRALPWPQGFCTKNGGLRHQDGDASSVDRCDTPSPVAPRHG